MGKAAMGSVEKLPSFVQPQPPRSVQRLGLAQEPDSVLGPGQNLIQLPSFE
jgi:hypothetical protein